MNADVPLQELRAVKKEIKEFRLGTLVKDGKGNLRGVVASKANHVNIWLTRQTAATVYVPHTRGHRHNGSHRVVVDKGCYCEIMRSWLRRKGVVPCIPQRKNCKTRRKAWVEECEELPYLNQPFARVPNFQGLPLPYEQLIPEFGAYFNAARIPTCPKSVATYLPDT